MRLGWIAGAWVVWVGCGASTALDGTPEPAVPSPGAAPTMTAADPNSCANSVDCTFSAFPDVVTVADCACRVCDGPAASLPHLDQLAERYAAICGATYEPDHGCVLPSCGFGHRTALCVSGRCIAEPITPSESGRPSPCRNPGECPAGVSCVVGALGGDLGCTNETCCDTAECSNGCATDADCPACRSECRSGACRRPEGP